jgi:hypothetical protein
MENLSNSTEKSRYLAPIRYPSIASVIFRGIAGLRGHPDNPETPSMDIPLCRFTTCSLGLLHPYMRYLIPIGKNRAGVVATSVYCK